MTIRPCLCGLAVLVLPAAAADLAVDNLAVAGYATVASDLTVSGTVTGNGAGLTNLSAYGIAGHKVRFIDHTGHWVTNSYFDTVAAIATILQSGNPWPADNAAAVTNYQYSGGNPLGDTQTCALFAGFQPGVWWADMANQFAFRLNSYAGYGVAYGSAMQSVSGSYRLTGDCPALFTFNKSAFGIFGTPSSGTHRFKPDGSASLGFGHVTLSAAGDLAVAGQLTVAGSPVATMNLPPQGDLSMGSFTNVTSNP